MTMDRSKMPVKMVKMSEQEDAGDIRAYVKPEDRLAVVWQLSKAYYAFKGEPVAEPGLYRHIVRLYRRKS